jgi:hypothetical protein
MTPAVLSRLLADRLSVLAARVDAEPGVWADVLATASVYPPGVLSGRGYGPRSARRGR